MQTVMTPVLILASWTLVMWVWMYATRLPAMKAAGIDPATVKQKSDFDALPLAARQVADNYNHLHEQPVIFYALALYSHTVGVTSELVIGAAWAYVIVRIAHSVFQATINFVPVRFGLFFLATLALFVMAVANLMALLG